MSTQRLKQAVGGGNGGPPINAYDKLRMQIMQRRNDFAQLLGPNKVDQFLQAVLTAVAHRPELLEADRASLILACRKAALDGLVPDGKDAVLNIYSTNIGTRESPRWIKAVQYLPMVHGIVRAMWRSGQFSMIDAAAVYERDLFSYRRGDSPCIEHEPYPGMDDPGEIVAAYFVGKLKSGEVKREVMWRRDLDKARAASKTPDKGPWVQWPDQMSIKSVLHRAAKQLDLAPEVQNTLDRDMKTMLGEDIAEIMQIPQAGADVGVEMQALPETAGGTPPPDFKIPREERVQSRASETAQDLMTGPETADEPSGGAPTQPAGAPPAGAGIPPAAIPADEQEAALNDLQQTALRMVKNGDIDTAKDLAKDLPEGMRAAVEREIAKRRK